MSDRVQKQDFCKVGYRPTFLTLGAYHVFRCKSEVSIKTHISVWFSHSLPPVQAKLFFTILFTELVLIFLTEDLLIDFIGDIVELFAPELHANPWGALRKNVSSYHFSSIFLDWHIANRTIRIPILILTDPHQKSYWSPWHMCRRDCLQIHQDRNRQVWNVANIVSVPISSNSTAWSRFLLDIFISSIKGPTCAA